MDKYYKIGYTQGVFDMFHIGHLNLIKNAKKRCDKLIVGVNSDRLVSEYKHKVPVVNEADRLEIVRNIKGVDDCVLVDTLDKELILKDIPYDAIFIGDDWKGNKRWEQTERDLSKYGVDVVYLKYTQGVSSTIMRSSEGDSIKE